MTHRLQEQLNARVSSGRVPFNPLEVVTHRLQEQLNARVSSGRVPFNPLEVVTHRLQEQLELTNRSNLSRDLRAHGDITVVEIQDSGDLHVHGDTSGTSGTSDTSPLAQTDGDGHGHGSQVSDTPGSGASHRVVYSPNGEAERLVQFSNGITFATKETSLESTATVPTHTDASNISQQYAESSNISNANTALNNDSGLSILPPDTTARGNSGAPFQAFGTQHAPVLHTI